MEQPHGQGLIKRFLPRSLLGRALLIIVSPLVLLQLVSALVFYESHWDKVSLRLARALAGDAAMVSTYLRDNPGADHLVWITGAAHRHMELRIEFLDGEILPNVPGSQDGDRSEIYLAEALDERLDKPFRIDARSLERDVLIEIQHLDGVLRILTTRKRLSSTTTYVFVMWMVGTSLILFGVALLFMRNQVRPIRRLARAAESFGKGRELGNFKPEGATEVRQAAAAFIEMRDRIKRQIRERTDMLAGVSHDLRTPLTRMRLQIAMMGKNAGARELDEDVAEMERMLDGYLAFARGEGGERSADTDLSVLLREVVGRARRKGGAIDLHSEGSIVLALKPNAFERCLTNLIENAVRFGAHVSVRAGYRDDHVEVVIDDDGPGIPPDQREAVFRPFIRLESSRNPETGGVGLGLAIARDVVRGHGGEITLEDAPLGGLRVRLRLPL